jgi:FAD/FMN-containing dehydrogenase
MLAGLAIGGFFLAASGAGRTAVFFLSSEDAATVGGATAEGEGGEREGEECFHGGVLLEFMISHR